MRTLDWRELPKPWLIYKRYKFIYADGSIRYFGHRDSPRAYGDAGQIGCRMEERFNAVVIIDLVERKFIKNRIGSLTDSITKYL